MSETPEQNEVDQLKAEIERLERMINMIASHIVSMEVGTSTLDNALRLGSDEE